MRAVSLGSWLLVVIAVQATALAAPPEDADALVRRGIELRKQLKDREALEQFQRAYQISPTPRIQAQVGAAEQALGRWVDAEAHVAQSLRATHDPWIGKNRSVLEQALVAIRSHLGRVDVIASPPGAEIRVDGRDAGRAPLSEPVRVAIGSVVIEVRAPGYFPATRTVVIPGGELVRETLSLQPVQAAEFPPSPAPDTRNLAPAPPPSDSGSASPSHVGAPDETVERKAGDRLPEPSGSGSWRRPLAWSLAAGALVFAGGGVAALVIRNGKANDYNKQIDMNGCTGASAPNCDTLRSDGNRAGTLAIAAFSAAGALAVTSIILFATTPESHRAPTALRACGLSPSPLALGAGCRVSF